MSDEKRSCPLCSGSMQVGFLLDVNHKNPAVELGEQMEWVAGDASPGSSWQGGIKLAGRERRKVVTFACTGCGYLQSFAQS